MLNLLITILTALILAMLYMVASISIRKEPSNKDFDIDFHSIESVIAKTKETHIDIISQNSPIFSDMDISVFKTMLLAIMSTIMVVSFLYKLSHKTKQTSVVDESPLKRAEEILMLANVYDIAKLSEFRRLKRHYHEYNNIKSDSSFSNFRKIERLNEMKNDIENMDAILYSEINDLKSRIQNLQAT